MKNIKVICYRYNKQADQAPYYKTYNVSIDEGDNISVYNILEYIYENIDPTLAFFSHAACKQVACGRCLLKVNGAAVLACKESVAAPSLLIEPVNEEKVIKDLVCC